VESHEQSDLIICWTTIAKNIPIPTTPAYKKEIVIKSLGNCVNT
jgi:hypothetical protein